MSSASGLTPALRRAFDLALPAGSAVTQDSFNELITRGGGRVVENTITCAGVTQIVDVFNFTGPFELLGLFGRITEATDVTDVTAANFDVDDGAVTAQLTSAAGVALTGAEVGALVAKLGAVAAAAVLMDADQVRINEALAALFGRTLINPLAGSSNQLRFGYTSAAAATDFDLHVVLWYADLTPDWPSGLAAA